MKQGHRTAKGFRRKNEDNLFLVHPVLFPISLLVRTGFVEICVDITGKKEGENGNYRRRRRGRDCQRGFPRGRETDKESKNKKRGGGRRLHFGSS